MTIEKWKEMCKCGHERVHHEHEYVGVVACEECKKCSCKVFILELEEDLK